MRTHILVPILHNENWCRWTASDRADPNPVKRGCPALTPTSPGTHSLSLSLSFSVTLFLSLSLSHIVFISFSLSHCDFLIVSLCRPLTLSLLKLQCILISLNTSYLGHSRFTYSLMVKVNDHMCICGAPNSRFICNTLIGEDPELCIQSSLK